MWLRFFSVHDCAHLNGDVLETSCAVIVLMNITSWDNGIWRMIKCFWLFWNEDCISANNCTILCVQTTVGLPSVIPLANVPFCLLVLFVIYILVCSNKSTHFGKVNREGLLTPLPSLWYRYPVVHWFCTKLHRYAIQVWRYG